MKRNDLDWPTINHTLVVLCQIKDVECDTANVVNRVHQIASSPVEAAAFGCNREQIPVVLPPGRAESVLVACSTHIPSASDAQSLPKSHAGLACRVGHFVSRVQQWL